MALGITQSPKAALDLLLAQRPSCKGIQHALSNRPGPKYTEHYVSTSDIHYPRAGEGSVYGPAFDPGVGVAFGAALTAANVIRNMSPEDWHNLSSTLEQILLLGSSASLYARVLASAIVTLDDNPIYEYRLTGFSEKAGTLAEHLAKVLNNEVAGYPTPDPNPENRATRVWCVTIRRVIREIDNTDYTERQLARDLEQAGISQEVWNEIKTAVQAAANGPCKDHWGDFTGGSLASG